MKPSVFTLSVVLLALSLVAQPAAASVIFTDESMRDQDWHEAWSLTLSPPDQTVNQRIELEPGNFARRTEVSPSWFRSVASLSVADTLGISSDEAQNNLVTLTFDAHYSGSHRSGRVAPALEVGGETFIGEVSQVIAANEWTTVTFSNLSADLFWSWKHGHTGYSDSWDTYPAPGGENPDILAGEPIRFGYYVHGPSNSSSGQTHRYTFDNFQLSLAPVPAPGAVTLMLAALGCGAGRQRR